MSNKKEEYLISYMSEDDKHKIDLYVSNHIVCDECGDTGRSYPTLSEPDGVVCEKCGGK